MKIEKYKYIKNGKYKITIKNEEYILYEDVIIKNNILLKNEITQKKLEECLKENNYYEAYYKALKYINIKLRTTKEIKKYLEKDFEESIIDKVLERLKKEKYLNDEIYTKAYISDAIILKNKGPLKIKKELTNLDIPEEVINENLKDYTKDLELEKIEKVIKKEISLNKNKSFKFLKNKILINLIEKGFHKELIIELLESIDYNDEEVYKKEYQKIKEKLSKKYIGIELEYKIKEKMYQKGFTNNI